MNRKIKILTMAAVSAATVMGTVPYTRIPIQAKKQKTEKAEKTMGRYLESDVALPDGALTLNSMVKLENGNLRIYYYSADGGQMYADSQDAGKTWDTPVSIGNLLGDAGKNLELYSIQLSKDGGIFLTGMDTAGESDYLSSQYFYIDKDKNVTELDLSGVIGSDDVLWDSVFTGNNTLVLSTTGQNKGLTEINLSNGSTLRTYEDGNNINGLAVVGDHLIVLLDDAVHYYDLKTGDTENDNDALTEQISSNDSNLQSMGMGQYPIVFTGTDDGKNLYYADSKGAYHYTFGGSVVEQIMDGSLNSLSSPDIFKAGMTVLDDGSIFVAANQNDNSGTEPKLLKYTYSKDAPAVPDTELTVYSLTDNTFLRQVAAAFQKKYPDIYLNLETGMTGDDAVTSTDAVKNLNTEIMAGKGPDLLVLDGLPEETYVEKGMLEDISGILKKSRLLENISSCYTEKDGSIYAMPVKFGIPMIQGKAEDIDKIQDLESLADVIEEHKDDYSSEFRSMNAAITPDMLLHSLSEVSSSGWLKEEGTLDEKAVREFYTQCQRIWKVSEESAKKFLEEMGQSDEDITYSRENNMIAGDIMSVLGDSVLLGEGGMYSSSDLAYLYSVEQQDTDLKSVLFNGQSENNFIPVQTMGISSKSKHKKAAEKFIRYLFSEEGQKLGADQGFPVNRKAYEDESTWQTGEDGTMVGTSSSTDTRAGKTITVNIQAASDERSEEIRKLGESLTQPVVTNQIILDAVADAGVSYLNGKTSLDEAVKNAVSQVNLYLSE